MTLGETWYIARPKWRPFQQARRTHFKINVAKKISFTLIAEKRNHLSNYYRRTLNLNELLQL